MQDTERPQFLTELLAEVDAFDAELFKPTGPVSSETEDKVVGVCTPWLRQLYAYGRYLHREARVLIAQHESSEDAQQDDEVTKLLCKHSVVMEILWAEIRSGFNLWNAASVGLRIDWQIVSSKPEPDEPDFLKFLSRMTRKK